MKKMNLLKKNPPSYNAFRGGSYSLIISAVVLALWSWQMSLLLPCPPQ